jgi:hypothetical protein
MSGICAYQAVKVSWMSDVGVSMYPPMRWILSSVIVGKAEINSARPTAKPFSDGSPDLFFSKLNSSNETLLSMLTGVPVLSPTSQDGLGSPCLDPELSVTEGHTGWLMVCNQDKRVVASKYTSHLSRCDQEASGMVESLHSITSRAKL